LAINWFSPVETTDADSRIALALEARRRAWWLGWAGPAGFAAAIGVTAAMKAAGIADEARATAAGFAVFFATVGVTAGVVGGSSMHSLAGVYAGMAAGTVIFIAASAGRWCQLCLTPGPGLGFIIAAAFRLGGTLGAFMTFGALFAWADRRPGRMKQGAGAAVGWFFAMILMAMVAGAMAYAFGVVLILLLGWIPSDAATVTTLWGVAFAAALVYAVHFATGRFFLDVRGWYDPMLRGMRAAKSRQAREFKARLRGERPAREAAEPEEPIARKGDTDEDDS